MRDGQDATPQPEPRWDLHGPRSGPCGFHLGIGIEITLAQQPEQAITEDPEVYDGTLLINGVEHHLTLIEVDETLGGDYQEATAAGGTGPWTRCTSWMTASGPSAPSRTTGVPTSVPSPRTSASTVGIDSPARLGAEWP
jgi:hypothetical protein